jgi:hypothetical protein
LRKQSSPTNSTDDGTQNDLSDEQPEKADSSIRFRREFGGKVTSSSFSQSPKQLTPINSTADGIFINFSAEQQENANHPELSIYNPTKKRLSQGHCSPQNATGQAKSLMMESKLMKVLNSRKTPAVQSNKLEKLIQT